jgi:tetratricopeptide (TPR) repeat protein
MTLSANVTTQTAPALFAQAQQWLRAGQFEGALACIDRVLVLEPQHFEARCFLAKILAQLQRRLDEALTVCDAVLALQARPDLINTRAAILGMLGRHEEALAACDRALALEPRSVYALSNRAMLLHNLRRGDEAIACYQHALALFPNDAALLTNFGAALADFWRPQDALTCYERALALQPNSADAMNGRGNALRLLCRFDEALRSFARAIELNPTHPMVRANHAQLTLLLGDFERGFQGYESRIAMLPPRADELNQRALWLGQPLVGKRIVLHGEQGLGDTIQFARYVERVAQAGATVYLEVQPALKTLFSGYADTAGVFAQGEALPQSEYRCSLMSLPFRFSTRLDTIPPRRLQPDAHHLSKWRARLGAGSKLRIGICWSGSTTHGDDHNRSIAFAQFAQALPAGADYYSLQRELRESDATALAARKDVVHFGEELEDFADTAALTELMDLVLSVDTAVAHVAGALGKPLRLLLPLVPDWRWMLEREDTPWYPTARLVRQTRLGHWGDTLTRVRERLVDAIRNQRAD